MADNNKNKQPDQVRNESQEEEKGRMTVEEAGRKGGESTSATHGSEFYRDIGRRGGKKGGQPMDETAGSESKEASADDEGEAWSV
jgi:general stress protein YciG